MSKRKYEMSFGALAALVWATSACAADLPVRTQPPAATVYAPLYNWTGLYVGANIGGVWGTGSTTVNSFVGGVPALTDYFPNRLGGGPSGWLGGAQVGYNYQMNSFVLGAETDFDWTDLRRSGSYTSAALPAALGGGTITTSGSARMDWLGTLRLRVGFLPTADNRLMIYGTGGLAYGGGRNFGSVVANGTALSWYGADSPTKTGWTIGGGVEYAITNNISLRGEYLYYNLGNQTETAVPNAAAAATLPGVYVTTKTQLDGSIFRIAANYKF